MRDFSWSLEQYLSSLDSIYIDDIKELRSNPGREIAVDLQGGEERQRSSFLYALLAPLLRHRPLSLIKQAGEGFKWLGGLSSAHPKLGTNKQKPVPRTFDDDIRVGTV